MFSLKTSVTFVQAGNSLFALVMIYRGISNTLASAIYDVVHEWDKKPMEVKCLIPFLFSSLFVPQIIATSLINKHMVSEKDIPPAYFDEGLLVREDQEKVRIREDQVVPV